MKERIFVNHTNHPAEGWGEEQKNAAENYGRIINMPFPDIPPEADSCQVKEMALTAANKIAELEPEAVLCQGEFSYTFTLVDALIARGINVMAACSERVVRVWDDEEGRTHKDAVFQFQQFREYLRAERK